MKKGSAYTILYAAGTDVFLEGVGKGEIAWAVIIVLAAVLGILALVALYARRRLKEKGIEG